MKKLWIKLSAVAFFLMSGLLYCQCALADITDVVQLFTPSTQDLSRFYLSKIFGQVGNALSGNLVPLALMFEDFNKAVLVLGAIIIMYNTIFAIVNTAHQGEVLGKKLDTIWVPLRCVAGFSLLVPGSTGYSTIQVFMMWVILQGIGAADSLWRVTVDAFMSLGIEGQSITANINVGTLKPLNDILKATVCLHYIYYQKNPTKASLVTDNLIPKNELLQDPTTRVLSRKFTFADTNNPYDYAQCGSYQYVVPSTTTNSKEARLRALDNDLPTITTSIFNNVAKEIIYESKDPTQQTAKSNPVFDYTKMVMDDVMLQVNSIGTPQQQWMIDTKNAGWITAGRYYYDLVSQSGGRAADYQFAQDLAFTGLTYSPDPNVGPGKILTNISNDANAQIGQPSPDVPSIGGGSGIGGYGGLMGALVNGMMPSISKMLTTSTTGNFMSQDPIAALSEAGTNMLYTVYTIWGIMLVVTLGASAAAGICASTSPTFLVLSSLVKMTAMPMFIICGAVYIAGLTLAAYVPLIPFMVFTFSAIGWIIAVVETMIAAPLVCIGIIQPEGHEVYGRAEPAIQLLTNVFLRPSLMIFGLICGLLTARVAINLVSVMYKPVLDTVLHSEPGQWIMSLVIYIGIIIAILNRCFSLIHIIPDRVLSWIGNQAQFGQYDAQMEQSVKGTFGAGAKTLGDAGTSAARAAYEGNVQDTAAAATKAKKENDARDQANAASISKADGGGSGPSTPGGP